MQELQGQLADFNIMNEKLHSNTDVSEVSIWLPCGAVVHWRSGSSLQFFLRC